ncbi:MAG: prepilin-type N-terminal cleavage/methylation domain-containing protein [Turicibacter sp.]|nr:prepilin-type N-terminal cleavage/methylation domain-containing protein [Turicibacter sp.]
MFNKILNRRKNKKRGFTLIELIIVIAIIAILAAIAVPAFGQIREKANKTADLANARTIYSVITAAVAQDMVSDRLPITNQEVKEDNVGKWGLTTIPKTRAGGVFSFTIEESGNVKILIDGKEIYPEDQTGKTQP